MESIEEEIHQLLESEERQKNELDILQQEEEAANDKRKKAEEDEHKMKELLIQKATILTRMKQRSELIKETKAKTEMHLTKAHKHRQRFSNISVFIVYE